MPETVSSEVAVAGIDIGQELVSRGRLERAGAIVLRQKVVALAGRGETGEYAAVPHSL